MGARPAGDTRLPAQGRGARPLDDAASPRRPLGGSARGAGRGTPTPSHQSAGSRSGSEPPAGTEAGRGGDTDSRNFPSVRTHRTTGIVDTQPLGPPEVLGVRLRPTAEPVPFRSPPRLALGWEPHRAPRQRGPRSPGFRRASPGLTLRPAPAQEPGPGTRRVLPYLRLSSARRAAPCLGAPRRLRSPPPPPRRARGREPGRPSWGRGRRRPQAARAGMLPPMAPHWPRRAEGGPRDTAGGGRQLVTRSGGSGGGWAPAPRLPDPRLPDPGRPARRRRPGLPGSLAPAASSPPRSLPSSPFPP